jgi:hypothetical protein
MMRGEPLVERFGQRDVGQQIACVERRSARERLRLLAGRKLLEQPDVDIVRRRGQCHRVEVAADGDAGGPGEGAAQGGQRMSQAAACLCIAAIGPERRRQCLAADAFVGGERQRREHQRGFAGGQLHRRATRVAQQQTAKNRDPLQTLPRGRAMRRRLLPRAAISHAFHAGDAPRQDLFAPRWRAASRRDGIVCASHRWRPAMSHTFDEATLALGIRVARRSPLREWAARVVATWRERAALARARQVVRDLDDWQLADAGIDASAILPPRPTITVEAGLMTTLMSMR